MKKIFSILLCFTLLVGLLVVPVSAADPLFVPTITDQVTLEGERTQYFIIDATSFPAGTKTYLYVFFEFNPIWGTRKAVNANIFSVYRQMHGALSFEYNHLDNSLGYHQYELVDMQWNLVNSFNDITTISDFSTIHYGSFDITDMSTGNLFFEHTPLLFYSEAVGESLATMEQTTMKTFSILTLCGVGLLALLMGLVLLSKKSLLFLR